MATHTQLPSQLLAPINIATYVYIAHIPMYMYSYVYIVQKWASTLIPPPCHTPEVDTSPAFHRCQADGTAKIGYYPPTPGLQFLTGVGG